MKCQMCGMGDVQHRSMVDCVNYLRWYINELHKDIAKLKDEIPRGECFLRSPIGRLNDKEQVIARLWIEGTPTLKHWERLQHVLNVMSDIFDEGDGFDKIEVVQEFGNSEPLETIK